MCVSHAHQSRQPSKVGPYFCNILWPVELRGVPVEDVEVFKYLGCFISSDGRLKKELSHRIGAAAGAFRTLSQVWSSRHIRLHTKGKLYRAAVLSNLLYGAESWNVSKSHTQQLHAFHMSCA